MSDEVSEDESFEDIKAGISAGCLDGAKVTVLLVVGRVGHRRNSILFLRDFRQDCE